jgi:hypothetical protein
MKICKRICGGLIAILILCTVPSCTLIAFLANPPAGDGARDVSSRSADREEARYTEWMQSLPDYIIPRICDYYKLHPERFKPTGQGEEIEIVGFAAFIKNDDYFKGASRCYIVNGTIFDPWRDPLEFVQDLNMNGYLEAKGERRPVANARFGICKRKPFKAWSGQPWERVLTTAR